MLSWRSSNVDEMVPTAFAKKRPLPPKEEVHWRVLIVVGFVIIYEAFVRMEPYVGFFRRIFSRQALSVGKLPRTAPMGGFTLAAAQVGQFIKCQRHPPAMAAILRRVASPSRSCLILRCHC